MLAGTALFAILMVIARAAVQSLTIDEGDTYLSWVAKPGGAQWTPDTNNHVLNSILMRIFVDVFGPSHLSLRAGAITGAVVYIAAMVICCRLVAKGSALQWVLFVCATLNPFVLDYLIAARGYGLAVAFLMAGLAIPTLVLLRVEPPGLRSIVRTCAISSVCGALAVASNMGIALVVVMALLMVFLWSCLRIRESVPSRRDWLKAAARILSACVLPAVLATALVSLSIILRFPKFAFTLGVSSWHECWRTVGNSLLNELNPVVVNPFLLPKIRKLGPYLLLLLALFCVLKAAVILWDRTWRRDPRARRLLEFAMVVLLIMIGAIVLHTLAFHIVGAELPSERKALWVVPLSALLAGALAAVRTSLRVGTVFSKGVFVALCCLAVWFLFSSRFSYFREWKWDSDSRRLYWIVSWYNHRFGVTEVPSCWRYVAVLNAYRAMSGHESLAEFRAPVQTAPPFLYPPDKQLYVLYYPDDEPFIKRHGLKIVYHGDITEATIAVRPDVEQTPCAPGAP